VLDYIWLFFWGFFYLMVENNEVYLGAYTDMLAHVKSTDPILAELLPEVAPQLLLKRSRFAHLVGVIMGQRVRFSVAQSRRRKLYEIFGNTWELADWEEKQDILQAQFGEKLLAQLNKSVATCGGLWTKAGVDIIMHLQNGTWMNQDIWLTGDSSICKLLQTKFSNPNHHSDSVWMRLFFLQHKDLWKPYQLLVTWTLWRQAVKIKPKTQ
jgi:3-methyladenine DNA glycosylase/8-oxoguanine DNA glycosylase